MSQEPVQRKKTEPELRREIEIADRRAALDALTSALGWTVGALFLLNGGGILLLPEIDFLSPTAMRICAALFLVGLLGTILAGLFGALIALHFVESAEDNLGLSNAKLDRQKLLGQAKRNILIVGVAIGVSLLSFFGACGFMMYEVSDRREGQTAMEPAKPTGDGKVLAAPAK